MTEKIRFKERSHEQPPKEARVAPTKGVSERKVASGDRVVLYPEDSDEEVFVRVDHVSESGDIKGTVQLSSRLRVGTEIEFTERNVIRWS